MNGLEIITPHCVNPDNLRGIQASGQLEAGRLSDCLIFIDSLKYVGGEGRFGISADHVFYCFTVVPLKMKRKPTPGGHSLPASNGRSEGKKAGQGAMRRNSYNFVIYGRHFIRLHISS